MGQLIIHAQITINGAFEAPKPDWTVMDPDSSQASLDQVELADALVPRPQDLRGPRGGLADAG